MSDAPTPKELLRAYQKLSPYDQAVHRQLLIDLCMEQGGPLVLMAMRLRRIGGLPAAPAPAQSGEVIPLVPRKRA